MATVYDIETALEYILTAQYGKDVRQAIHDAIHACFDEGGSGSIDLTAREGITNLTLETEAALAEMNLHSGRTVLLDNYTIATNNETLILPKMFLDFDSVWMHITAIPPTSSELAFYIGDYLVPVSVPHDAEYSSYVNVNVEHITSQNATVKYISDPIYWGVGGGDTKTDMFYVDEFPLPMYDDQANQQELTLSTRKFKITNCASARITVIGYGNKSSDTGTAAGLVRDVNGIVHFV